MMRIIGYVRVSTAEQATNGAGLDAQRTAIRTKAAAEGWHLVDIVEDAGLSGGLAVHDRAGLTAAIARVERGEADGLAVAKLDRLTRSLLDFATIMERSRKKRWALIALDLGIDTSTPSGEMMANVLATFAQFERRLIAQRTRDALAVKKAQGVVLGRPRRVSGELVTRIRKEREDGQTLTAIAARLNVEGVPTVHGGRQWWPATVARHLA
jgi:DNA invertase Pin-like site-specific DNA recombinase